MDLKQLRAMGAIVPSKLFKRDIPIRRPGLKPEAEWEDPEVPEETGEMVDETITVYIRKGSSADAIEIANASARERPFVAVFRSVCNEKGEQVFTDLADVMRLATWLVIPLWEVITEVGEVGSKNSLPRTSSGARSHSASAAARSRSGKTRSRSTKSRSGKRTGPSVAP